MNTKKIIDINGMYDGAILPTTIRIGYPIIAANILQFLYTVVDTYFISRIDPTSTAILSGTGLVFPLFFLFMALGMSIGIGLGTTTGRALGEKNINVLSNIIPSGIIIVFFITTPLLAIGYKYGDIIIHLLSGGNITPKSIYYGQTYLQSILPSMGLMIVGQIFIGPLRGEGLTGVIAQSRIISTFLNVILDPIFMFKLNMGVAGAGLATTLSILISIIYVAIIFFSGKTSVPISFNIFKAKLSVIKNIVRVALPGFIAMSSLSVSFIVLNKLVTGINEDAMNIWTLSGRLDQLILMPAFAIADATTTMVSQNYGRGLLNRVKSIYYKNILLGIGSVLFFFLFFFSIAPIFFSYFSTVPNIIHGAVRQTRILSPTYIGIAVTVISSSTFQATGKSSVALFITLIRIGVFVLPSSYIFTLFFKLGLNGVYLAMMLGNLIVIPISFIVIHYHFKKLTFKKVT